MAEKLSGWQKAALVLAEGMAAFGEGMTGQPFHSNFQRMQSQRQQQKLLEMRQDAELGLKGYERLSSEEVNDYLTTTKKMGKTPSLGKADGGVVATPDGSTYKDGQIFDKGGKVIGEYAEGYEPKPAKFFIDRTGDYLTIGDNYYRWNADLAEKMTGLKAKPKPEEINATLNKLNSQLSESGQGGSWQPSTTRVGGNTFRYQPYSMPTAQQMPISEQSPMTGQPLAQETPQETPVSSRFEVENAIQNALSNGESMKNIIEGIRAEGYDPKDFEHLFNKTQSKTARKSFLKSVMDGSPLSDNEKQYYIEALSRQVDRRRSNNAGV